MVVCVCHMFVWMHVGRQYVGVGVCVGVSVGVCVCVCVYDAPRAAQSLHMCLTRAPYTSSLYVCLTNGRTSMLLHTMLLEITRAAAAHGDLTRHYLGLPLLRPPP